MIPILINSGVHFQIIPYWLCVLFSFIPLAHVSSPLDYISNTCRALICSSATKKKKKIVQGTKWSPDICSAKLTCHTSGRVYNTILFLSL